MVYYAGSYYGDWSVYEMLEKEPMLQAFDAAKANPPKLPRRQAKIIVTTKGGVCLDVKSNIPDGLWEYAIVDYDNQPDLAARLYSVFRRRNESLSLTTIFRSRTFLAAIFFMRVATALCHFIYKNPLKEGLKCLSASIFSLKSTACTA